MRRGWLIVALVALTACGGSDRDRGLLGSMAGALFGDSDALCRDSRLEGEVAGTVPGPGACGIDNAVRITAVDGVRLSQPALLNCRTARALADWVEDGAQRAVGRRGGGLETLHVAAHYVCRTRNHRPGARLSEHSFGNAIDISGVTLKNGDRLTVTEHYDAWGRSGRIVRRMHDAACGPFGTVLGPESDRYHQNHFHFDTARHRGGPYCR